MRFVFLVKLELQDASDSLDVLLWRDAVRFPACSGRPGGGADGGRGLCHQELFFGVTAEDAAANQESQSRVCRVLERLCPPGGSTGTFLLKTGSPEAPPTHLARPLIDPSPVFVSSGERPWLDLCLLSYRVEDDGGRSQTCYQVCHTAVATPT